ncbi:MAG: serine hydrolase family protein, partial [Sulfurovum sp.]
DGMATIERLFMVSPPSLRTTEKTIKTFFPCPLPKNIYAKEVYILVSDNDPWITLDEAKEMASHYDADFSIIHNAGHINADSGYGKWELIEQLVIGEKNDKKL